VVAPVLVLPHKERQEQKAELHHLQMEPQTPVLAEEEAAVLVLVVRNQIKPEVLVVLAL
jgi:hypothetical protein